MISRGLLISLGITLLASVMIFMYFRKRLSVVEHKLNMMFQLIEEHNQQQNVQIQPRYHPPAVSTNLSPIEEEEMITVSDGENSDSDTNNDSETDDSASESSDDNTLSGQIEISSGENDNSVSIGEIKHINLTLNNAMNKSNDGLDDLESLGDSINDLNIQPLESNTDDEKENEQYNQLIDTITTNIIVENKEDNPQVDLQKLRVPELKKIAKEKNIKTKGLRKAELISAINEN